MMRDNGSARSNGIVRTVAETIPTLVDQLCASRAGHVHADVLALVERAVFAHVLEVTGGNQLQAARILGINRNTLRKYCRRLGIASTSAPPRNGVANQILA